MRTFEALKGVLCFYSGYLKTSLNGSFLEAQRGVVKLPAEDPKVFEIFINWIQTRCLLQVTIAPETLLSLETIADIWFFADAHDVPMLQNEAIDVMVRKISCAAMAIGDTLALFHYISESAPQSSALWVLIVDIARCMEEWFGVEECSLWDTAKVLETLETTSEADFKEGLKDFRKLKNDEGYRCTKWHTHQDGLACIGD
jgi:hypothetical protein